MSFAEASRGCHTSCSQLIPQQARKEVRKAIAGLFRPHLASELPSVLARGSYSKTCIWMPEALPSDPAAEVSIYGLDLAGSWFQNHATCRSKLRTQAQCQAWHSSAAELARQLMVQP